MSNPLVIDSPKIGIPSYSVEFFHIYSDETINEGHSASIEYVKLLKKAWPHELNLAIMIDNYNADSIVTTEGEILTYLESQEVLPSFWAFEADLIQNAETLIEHITSPKLKKEYRKYVDNRNKYPCSLLAAAWYLTRLGRLGHNGVIRSSDGGFVEEYIPADRLINFLPESYKSVEERIIHLIKNSDFSEEIDNIQDLFYFAENGKIRELA